MESTRVLFFRTAVVRLLELCPQLHSPCSPWSFSVFFFYRTLSPLERLRILGVLGPVHVSHERRYKLESTRVPDLLLRYVAYHDGYIMHDRSSARIFYTRTLHFSEADFLASHPPESFGVIEHHEVTSLAFLDPGRQQRLKDARPEERAASNEIKQPVSVGNVDSRMTETITKAESHEIAKNQPLSAIIACDGSNAHTSWLYRESGSGKSTSSPAPLRSDITMISNNSSNQHLFEISLLRAN